jgi:4-carboxymuconolactone decarboxylase
MTHIAIQEAQDGKSVDWLEQGDEEQYRADPPSSAEPAPTPPSPVQQPLGR